MKHLILFSFIFFISSIYGQCPDGNVSLSTQEELNTFLSEYPNCSQIQGDLTIGPQVPTGELTDISGLNIITEVQGTLRIQSLQFNDTELDSLIPGNLTGLENINSVKNLVVGLLDNFGNPLGSFPPQEYDDLSPLGNISGPVDSLWLGNFVVYNELPEFNLITEIDYFRLVRTTGFSETPVFSSLSKIRDFTVVDNRYLGQNPIVLEEIIIPDGIGIIEEDEGSNFAGIYIQLNDSLTEILGGANLIEIKGDLIITNNPILSDLNGFNTLERVVHEDSGGISLSACNPEAFNSFPSLTECASISIDNEECSSMTELVEIGLGSSVQNLNVISGLIITLNNVNTLNFSGNLKKVGRLNIASDSVTEITGLETVDSIADGLGNLRINAPYLSSLPNFESLKYVDGEIRIFQGVLADIQGFSSLERCGSLILRGHELTSLNGLNNLEIVEGDLQIRDQPNLTSIEALGSLMQVGELLLDDLQALEGDFNFESLVELDRLRISDTGIQGISNFPALLSIESGILLSGNQNLLTINGFNSLQELHGLSITSSPLLLDIAFPLDISFSGNLSLSGNTNLENCGTSASICNIAEQADFITLSGNGEACNDSTSLAMACSSLGINMPSQPNFNAYFINANSLYLKHDFNVPFKISLFNTMGQQIYSQMSGSISEELIELGNKLRPGIYILRLSIKAQDYSLRIPYYRYN